eukprot:gene23737-biopygen7331
MQAVPYKHVTVSFHHHARRPPNSSNGHFWCALLKTPWGGGGCPGGQATGRFGGALPDDYFCWVPGTDALTDNTFWRPWPTPARENGNRNIGAAGTAAEKTCAGRQMHRWGCAYILFSGPWGKGALTDYYCLLARTYLCLVKPAPASPRLDREDIPKKVARSHLPKAHTALCTPPPRAPYTHKKRTSRAARGAMARIQQLTVPSAKMRCTAAASPAEAF